MPELDKLPRDLELLLSDVDRPNAEETLSLTAGATVSARAAGPLFSEELVEELGRDGVQT